MGTKGQVCRRCRNFERYYIKGSTEFKATELGKCSCKRDSVEANGTCERYAPKRQGRRINGYLQKRINDYLVELTTIRQILEESISEHDGTEEV